jgi:hypothetical protein
MNVEQTTLRPCPDCQHPTSTRATTCPNCGGPLWHKSVKEAYSPRGLGLIDLIPGIRDAPYGARLLIGICAVILLVLFIVPLVLAR